MSLESGCSEMSKKISSKNRGASEIPQHLNGTYINNFDTDFASDASHNTTREKEPDLGQEEQEFFRQVLEVLNSTGIQFAVGSAFARYFYTSIWRRTKDLDIFLKPDDLRMALDALSVAGFSTSIEYRHWLAKARSGPYFVDLIFGTGHGQYVVDKESFIGSQRADILGVNVLIYPIEEIMVSDMYIAERTRFDGADIVHLILSAEGKLDWTRILDRLNDNWELLLWHLILFDFIYPGHSDYLPKDLMAQLFERVRSQWSNPEEQHSFRGTLLDPFSFMVDITDWDYEDRRKLEPLVKSNGEVL